MFLPIRTAQVSGYLGGFRAGFHSCEFSRFPILTGLAAVSAAALFASVSSADNGAERLQLLPVLIDGDGIQSRLIVTNVSGSSSHCSVDFSGPGLDGDRFEDHFLLTVDGARATFELEGDGGSLVWTSDGEQSLTYGYARLDCSEPVAAQALFSLSDADGIVSMTGISGAGKAGEFQFTMISRVGSLELVFANDENSAASCEIRLISRYGSVLSETTFSVPEMTSVFQAADALFRIPEDFAEGAVRVFCDREVAATGFVFNGSVFAVLPPAPVPPPPVVTLALSTASIGEKGGIATVTASLNHVSAQPTTITVSVSPDTPATTADYSLSSNTVLTIAAGATTSTGTVTLTGIDNDLDTSDKTVHVIGMAVNTQGVTAPVDIQLTLLDDDTRGVTVSASTLDINENDEGTYTVVLDTQPTANVTVTPSRNSGDTDDTDVTVSGALTFTAANWNTAQTVTVSAASDPDTVDDSAVIANGVSGASSDYASVSAGSVSVTVDDNTPSGSGSSGSRSSGSRSSGSQPLGSQPQGTQPQGSQPQGSQPPDQNQADSRPVLTGLYAYTYRSNGRGSSIRWDPIPDTADITDIQLSVEPAGAVSFFSGSLRSQLAAFSCAGGFKGNARITVQSRIPPDYTTVVSDTATYHCD